MYVPKSKIKKKKSVGPAVGNEKVISSTRDREREGRPGSSLKERILSTTGDTPGNRAKVQAKIDETARFYDEQGNLNQPNPTAETVAPRNTQGIANLGKQKSSTGNPTVISSGPGPSFAPNQLGEMADFNNQISQANINRSLGTNESYDFRGAAEQIGQTLAGDVTAAQQALAARQANEQGAMGITQQGTSAVGAGQDAARSISEARRGNLAGGNVEGRAGIAGAQQNVSGMGDRFGAKSGQIKGGMQGQSQQALSQAQRRTGGVQGRGEMGGRAVQGGQAQRGGQNIQSVMQNVKEQTNFAMQEAFAGADDLMKRADAVKGENLQEYRNMTAEAGQIKASALAANTKMAKQQIMDNIPDGPAREEALVQLRMDSMQRASDEVGKISMAYNDGRAQIRSTYDQIGADVQKFGVGVYAQARNTFGQLQSTLNDKIRTAMSGQQLQAGLTMEGNLLNSAVAMAGQSTALQNMALQQFGQLSNTDLETMGWIEQNGAKMLTELAGMSARMWEAEQQMGIQNDQNETTTQLAYDNLLSERFTELADRYSGQTADYIPLAPYEFQMIQLMAEIEDREAMNRTTGGAFA